VTQIFSILAGSSFTAIVCLSLGMFVLRRVEAPLCREEKIPLALITGAACLSLIVFLLGIAGLVYDSVFVAVGIGAVVLAAREKSWRCTEECFPPLPVAWRVLFLVVFLVFGTLYFFHAMAPEISPDGSTYHLGLVSRYWREHGLFRITNNMYASLSQGIEMLYLFAFAFGRHSAAALVHFVFLVSLPLAMLSYGRRFGFEKAGVVGSLLFFVSPVVGLDGSTAYNDVAVTAVLFALFYLLRVWGECGRDGLLFPIGLLAGFGYASKYTAMMSVPFALGYVAWKLHHDRKPLLKPLLVVAGCAFLMVAPWMVKNAVWVDNPVAPFFNSVFPNHYVHSSFEKMYMGNMRHGPGLENRLDIPLEVTVRGSTLSGLLGPVFLLAPIALFALGSGEGRVLLLTALVFLATYPANIGTRFLLPALPYISLAMGLVLTRISLLAPALVLAHAVLSWPAVMPLYCSPVAWRLHEVLWKEALRIVPEEEFFRRRFPAWTAARMIEENTPPGARVLTFSGVPEAYTTREILVVYQSAETEVLGDMWWMPMVPRMQPTTHRYFEFPARSLRKIRLVQTTAEAPQQWSVAEVRLFHDGNRVRRTGNWTPHARPNPWDAWRAFDNSLITRWRSWQALYDGMTLEADLGRPREIDTVVVDGPAEDWSVRLRLEGAGTNGRWEPINAKRSKQITPPPPGLRRKVTEELKREGVGYLLVREGEFGAEDHRDRAREWGITPLGEADRFTLYRID